MTTTTSINQTLNTNRVNDRLAEAREANAAVAALAEELDEGTGASWFWGFFCGPLYMFYWGFWKQGLISFALNLLTVIGGSIYAACVARKLWREKAREEAIRQLRGY